MSQIKYKTLMFLREQKWRQESLQKKQMGFQGRIQYEAIDKIPKNLWKGKDLYYEHKIREVILLSMMN